jgi:hypothetical protein
MSSAGVSTATRPAHGETSVESAQATDVHGAMAFGWLAVLPLVLAYEIALGTHPDSPRNTAEFLITLPFQALLARPEIGRWALEALATGAAVWVVFHAELGLVRRVSRLAIEGFVAAVVLGPLLLVLLRVLDVAPPAIARPDSVATPVAAALFAGGAAFEEIVFRVGVLAAFVLVARRTFEWFLGLPRAARFLAEITALLGSSVLFAAAHLDVVVGLVSPGGEPYDGARFAWRVVAGLALALLFRWRGMGVAAWCHAFFNLALALGAGPEVFL